MSRMMKRFELDITARAAERYDLLVDECDLKDRTELFHAIMALFDWAVAESRKGKAIASYDEERDEVCTIIQPALESAKRSGVRLPGREIEARPATGAPGAICPKGESPRPKEGRGFRPAQAPKGS